jgi:ribosome modulation factor
MAHNYDATPDYIEAFQDGRDAATSDKPKSSNPYRTRGTDEQKAGWDDGWKEATYER